MYCIFVYCSLLRDLGVPTESTNLYSGARFGGFFWESVKDGDLKATFECSETLEVHRGRLATSTDATEVYREVGWVSEGPSFTWEAPGSMFPSQQVKDWTKPVSFGTFRTATSVYILKGSNV